jgi:membrane protein implicated in regulation of membrane protease activity
MDDWVIWLMAAGIVVLVELFTGTFYLLMVALGMVAGAILAGLHASLSWQLLVGGAVGAVASWLLHNSKYGYRQRRVDSARNPDVNMDVGQQLRVDAWQDQGHGRLVARAQYRGAQWDVEWHQSVNLAHAVDHAGGSTVGGAVGSISSGGAVGSISSGGTGPGSASGGVPSGSAAGTASAAMATPGMFRIVEVQGSRLIVKPV